MRKSGALSFRARTATKRALAGIGLEIRRANSLQTQPIGDLRSTLEGLRSRGLAPTTVLDVGANRGDWTQVARAIFPLATFVLLEPQIEMAPYLDELGVPWHLAAVGSEDGVMDLTIWPDRVGSSFLKPNGGTYPTRSVDVVTVDHLIAREGYAIPELVKLDIQGFELQALLGARSLFGVTEAFILEVSLFSPLGQPILREVVDFMGERGYEAYDIAGSLRRPSDGALGQLDLCFARVDGVLRQSNRW